jgi:hypothetical protein
MKNKTATIVTFISLLLVVIVLAACGESAEIILTRTISTEIKNKMKDHMGSDDSPVKYLHVASVVTSPVSKDRYKSTVVLTGKPDFVTTIDVDVVVIDPKKGTFVWTPDMASLARFRLDCIRHEATNGRPVGD